ncbi:hypothetical protein [Hydrogenophaga sp. 5NK40-0174]|uniref:DUF7383 domain-containing protein n=1 Tax=Hydrogenophaga sp. 5NK40-0174 TaxID=3127649 RepID=UPI0031065994
MGIARSDFNLIMINEHLGDNEADLNTDFPFMGSHSTKKRFRIEGRPVDDAYVLFNHTQVNSLSHTILINDTELPFLPIMDADDKPVTQMARINPGTLVQGTNTFQVVRRGGDNFIFYFAVVNWRESTQHE